MAGGVAYCPLREVFFYGESAFGYCPLYGVAGCPLWRGSERTEVYGKTTGPETLSVISQVSAVEGCPLGGVPL